MVEPIDRSEPVVRDQQRAVGSHHHVDRPPPGGAVLKPAGRELLVGRGPPRAVQADQHDPVTDRIGPVPRPVFRDEDLALVPLRKRLARVKAHAQGRHVRAEFLRRRPELGTGTERAEVRIGNVSAVAEGISEVLAVRGQHVEFVRRPVVTQQVATVVREPQPPRPGMPVEADRVADAPRHDLVAAVAGHPQDGVVRVGLVADVARSTHRHVELSIGPKADELPTVVRVGRKPVGDHERLRRRVQPVLDAVVPEYPADLGHVEASVSKGDSVRRVQTRCDDVPLIRNAVAVGIDQSMDPANLPRADENRAARALRERPGADNTLGEEADRESVRQLDLGQPRHLGAAQAGANQRCNQRKLQAQPGASGDRTNHGPASYQSMTVIPATMAATARTLRPVSGSAKKTRPSTRASAEPMPRLTVSTKPTQAC